MPNQENIQRHGGRKMGFLQQKKGKSFHLGQFVLNEKLENIQLVKVMNVEDSYLFTNKEKLLPIDQFLDFCADL